MSVIFGEKLQLEIYGQSHGPCIGIRMNGLPAGKRIDTMQLQDFLNRRAPGRNAWSTPRKEADHPEFLSGVTWEEPSADGQNEDRVLLTTGKTLEAVIHNTNIRPKDYANTAVIPRPGHADYPAWVKYGKIASGGGMFSARLTAALCIAGGICSQWLAEQGIYLRTHIASIGGIQDAVLRPDSIIDPDFPVVDPHAGEAMKRLIAEVKAAGDSIGGSIACEITGVPAGLGSPWFGSIESRICQTVFMVPAVKGIAFGAGFDVAGMRGSENNDPFRMEDGRVITTSNHHGGILGGLSSGMPISFQVAMKPTPSIAMEQDSVDLEARTNATLQVHGRHDPCIVPRGVPCIEAAAAIAICDICMEEERI